MQAEESDQVGRGDPDLPAQAMKGQKTGVQLTANRSLGTLHLSGDLGHGIEPGGGPAFRTRRYGFHGSSLTCSSF
jgi:hypothetical protein